MIVTLLQGVTEANSAPSAATDGVPLWRGAAGFLNAEEGIFRDTPEAALVLWNTAGTGAISIAFAKVWVYVGTIWTPLGTGVADDKGKLNYHDVAGTATYTIASVANDILRHTERLRSFKEATRMALQLSTFTGTFTVKAQLVATGVGLAVN
jgi:hypothetical protein